MRDDHHRHAQLPVELFQQFEDRARRLGVERGGRLVAQQHLRVAGQSAGDGHALLLPAGQLHRISPGLVRQLDQLQQLLRPPARRVFFDAGQLQREADVLQRGALHQQMEALEDHAHGFAGAAEFCGAHRGQIPAVEQHLPAVRALEQVDAAHQRALARAGQADDAEDLAVRDPQTDIVQSADLRIGAAEALAQMPKLDHVFSSVQKRNRPYQT